VVLGDLQPSDVTVQLVHGQVGQGDEFTHTETAAMHADGWDDGAARYVGTFFCDDAGRYGYTVRVLQHPQTCPRLRSWAASPGRDPSATSPAYEGAARRVRAASFMGESVRRDRPAVMARAVVDHDEGS
jgi:hypothetical protein